MCGRRLTRVAVLGVCVRGGCSPWAAHRLACLTGEGASAESAQAAYVQQVFDDLADSFETKLVQHLHYRVRRHTDTTPSAMHAEPSF